MKLKANYRNFIRFGLIAFGVAGILFALGDAFIPQGIMFEADSRPEEFARLVTGGNFSFWDGGYLWMAAYSWNRLPGGGEDAA